MLPAQEIFKQIIDANKNAYDATWNAVNSFQEKAEEALDAAFEKSPLPQEAKDAGLNAIESYKKNAKEVLDANKAAYENMVKTITASQEQCEEMSKESLEKTLLPEEAQKAILQATGLYKEGCTELQKAVEENYAKMETSLES